MAAQGRVTGWGGPAEEGVPAAHPEWDLEVHAALRGSFRSPGGLTHLTWALPRSQLPAGQMALE